MSEVSARQTDRVFVDTSALFAVVSRRDARHESARATLQRLGARRVLFITTNIVVIELHALTLSRGNRGLAVQALAMVDNSDAITVVRALEVDEQRARTIVNRYVDKEFTLADAISFAVMEREQISVYPLHFRMTSTSSNMDGE